MLEFVDSDLYFVQAKNNFINPLLQVGSRSGSVKKSTHRIRIRRAKNHRIRIIISADNAHPYILSSLFRYIMVSLYKKLFSPVSTNDEEKDLEIQSKIRLEIVYGS